MNTASCCVARIYPYPRLSTTHWKVFNQKHYISAKPVVVRPLA